MENNQKSAQKTFSHPVRIYYEDTDAEGIVYYANYLRFAERARTEFLRHLGFFAQREKLDQKREGFVVRRLEADYATSAVLDDYLDVSCEILELKNASVTMRQIISRADQKLFEMKINLVYLSLDKKRPIRIPAEIVEKLHDYQVN